MQRRRMRATTVAAAAHLHRAPTVAAAAYLHRAPTVPADAGLAGHAGAVPAGAGAGRLLRRPEHATAAVLPSASYRLPTLLQQHGVGAFGATACCRFLLRDRTMSCMVGCGLVAE
jgi:hypothetical protein